MKYGRWLTGAITAVVTLDIIGVACFWLYQRLGTTGDSGAPTFAIVGRILAASWFPGALVTSVVVNGVVLFFTLAYVFTPPQSKTAPSEENQSFALSSQAIRLPGFRFFPSREHLQAERPIKSLLESTNTVWAFWNTGELIGIVDGVKTGHIKRMLLPNPDDDQLKALSIIADRSVDYLSHAILSLTNQARLGSVPVRWADAFATSTIMIGNPDAPDGWAQVELLLAKTSASTRPSFVIGKKEYPELFAALRQSFDDLWHKSMDVSKEATRQQAPDMAESPTKSIS